MLHTVKNLATILLYEALKYKYIADQVQIRICSVQWTASYSRVCKIDMNLHNASFSNLEETRPYKKSIPWDYPVIHFSFSYMCSF